MTKMQCLRDHSSVVWGNVSAGDVFDVADGYVDQLEAEGLAKRLESPQDVREPMRMRKSKI